MTNRYLFTLVINGCNDEIGKEFAVQLANIGLDLILIAPDDKQLTNQFTDEIGLLNFIFCVFYNALFFICFFVIVTKYKVQCVKIYVSPGSIEELAFYDDIAQCVKDKNVGILSRT